MNRSRTLFLALSLALLVPLVTGVLWSAADRRSDDEGADSFFKQVSDWCEAHGIKISGHVWEETLPMEAAFEGDLQRIMRAWSWPGVDELWDKGRSPRDFKATASVAHFRNTRFTCENQGLQGADSYLDFQKMRLGTNMIAAWGANLFIPHAFNYNRTRIEGLNGSI